MGRLRKSDVAGEITPQTWLRGALKALEESGIDGVRIEPLAKQLNLTKGSFYWHFKDRDALLAALLADWRRRSTLDVIERIEQSHEAPRDRLRKLLSLSLIEERSAKGANNVELAIRLWGRTDERARLALAEVDTLRLRYVRNLLVEAGIQERETEARAVLIYSFMRVAATMVDKDKERIVEDALDTLLGDVAGTG